MPLSETCFFSKVYKGQQQEIPESRIPLSGALLDTELTKSLYKAPIVSYLLWLKLFQATKVQ